MRTHEIGDQAERWVADRLTAMGFEVEALPRNTKAVDLAVTKRDSRFRVQVKCSDHQQIKFPSLSALDGLAAEDFVIALMPSMPKTPLSFRNDDMWIFVIPALTAQRAARHVHESYRLDRWAKTGIEPAGTFGPTVKFYRKTSWQMEAQAWLRPYRDAWAGLPEGA